VNGLHQRLLRHLHEPYIKYTGETAWVDAEDALLRLAALRAVVGRCAYISDNEDDRGLVKFADDLCHEIAENLGIKVTD